MLSLVLILFMAGVSIVDAQQMRGASAGAEMFITQYGDELNLTEDQKKQLLNAAIERRSQMRGARTERMQPRRGAAMQRGERGVQRAERGQRNERRMEGQRPDPLYQDILTDEQMERLNAIRAERIESRKDVQMLRNRVAVGNAGIEEGKQAETVELLNRRTEIMAGIQWQRGQTDLDRREVMVQMRELNDELKNLLSAAEYEKLQQTMAPVRQPRHRAAMMRRGR